MTTDEMRVAVAESLGFTECEANQGYGADVAFLHNLIIATAAKRCEAYLTVKGLLK